MHGSTNIKTPSFITSRPKHVEQLRNTGIINSTTRLHLVGSFYEIYITMHGSTNIKTPSFITSRPKYVEQLRNIGIINSTTQMHLVGSFYEIYITMHGSINIKFSHYFSRAALPSINTVLWSLYLLPGLAFRNSTFCLQSAFMFLCAFQNKQQFFFSYTTLADSFLWPRRYVFTARYNLIFQYN